MEIVCYLSAATIKDHPYLSIFVPILVILWVWLIIYLGKRMGLDRFNNGDEDTLSPEDFFMHGKDPHL